MTQEGGSANPWQASGGWQSIINSIVDGVSSGQMSSPDMSTVSDGGESNGQDNQDGNNTPQDNQSDQGGTPEHKGDPEVLAAIGQLAQGNSTDVVAFVEKHNIMTGEEALTIIRDGNNIIDVIKEKYLEQHKVERPYEGKQDYGKILTEIDEIENLINNASKTIESESPKTEDQSDQDNSSNDTSKEELTTIKGQLADLNQQLIASNQQNQEKDSLIQQQQWLFESAKKTITQLNNKVIELQGMVDNNSIKSGISQYSDPAARVMEAFLSQLNNEYVSKNNEWYADKLISMVDSMGEIVASRFNLPYNGSISVSEIQKIVDGVKAKENMEGVDLSMYTSNSLTKKPTTEEKEKSEAQEIFDSVLSKM